MADALTHVLVAYVVFTALSWRVEWLSPRWVAVAMVGAMLPDLNRIRMLIDEEWIETTVGIPFDWGAIHTLGGLIVLSGIGALCFSESRQRRIAFGTLIGGGLTHLALDAVKAWADGFDGVSLYPLSWWRNPTPGWYVSADRWVLAAALALALVVFVIDYRRR